ncbi:MAG: Rrf2 family transcriptional regulator [Chloroflexota bacterium]
MFRINRRTDYSIRVMMCLAKRSVGTRLATQTIQQEMHIPRPFLQRIIADLSKAGLVHTYPGPNGGLELAHSPEKINLRHIWEAVEGPLLVSDCLKSPGECPLDSGCPVHCRWRRIQAMLEQELEGATLAELAREALALAALPGEVAAQKLYALPVGQ